MERMCFRNRSRKRLPVYQMYIFQVQHLIPHTVFSLTQVLILKPFFRPDPNVSSGSSNGGPCVGMSCNVSFCFDF